tara:strand:+ start:3269 stop:3928 length:660 start_codon:yes stop_codon:yes gene_type:complete
MEATFDNFTYTGCCSGFKRSIMLGQSQPYTRELNLVKKYLEKYPNKNNTYLDIGGHIGTTSLPYSRLYKSIIVYEPNKNNYSYLFKNIDLNQCTNVIAKNVAISNKTSNCNTIYHGCNSGCYYTKENRNGSINQIKLDDEKFENNVDFIKIDTEGSELFVLQGCEKIINRYKPLIQIECNGLSDKYFNYSKKEIYDFMKNKNYKILDDNGNDPLFYYDN